MSKARDLSNIPAGGYDVNFYEDTGTTPKFFWDASAESLGIGTSSPSGTLDVNIGTNARGYFANNIGEVGSGNFTLQVVDSTGASLKPLGFRSEDVRFATGSSERMRIDSSGNLLVGTSSALAGSGKAQFKATSAGYVINTRVFQNGDLGVNFQNQLGSQVGYIQVNSASTSYNTSSDYRLKENVVDLTGATDRLKQLPVRQFNFITDPDVTVDGFLAHEAQAVVPEAVTGTKDEVDDEGNPVYQGIDQSKLVPLLTAALQEAIAEIDSLKQRVDALEGN